MRISDWSSDVCSSDLPHRNYGDLGTRRIREIERMALHAEQARDELQAVNDAVIDLLFHELGPHGRMAARCAAMPSSIWSLARADRSSRSSILPFIIVRFSLYITPKVPSSNPSPGHCGTPTLHTSP